MYHAWTIGRLSLLSLVFVGLIANIGCEQPLSMLRLILSIQQESAAEHRRRSRSDGLFRIEQRIEQ